MGKENMKKMQAVRLDERMRLQIREIAELTQSTPSIVIRMLIRRAINEVTDDEGNYHLGLRTTMRNRLRKKQNPSILKRIGEMYDDLRYDCLGFDRDRITPEQEDVFQDTIIQVAADNIKPDMSKADFTEYFLRRYKMVRYQTLQDNRQRKGGEYADYT